MNHLHAALALGVIFTVTEHISAQLPVQAPAQPENADESSLLVPERVYEFTEEEAALWTLKYTNSDDQLTRVSRPLLRWSNSSGIPVYGDTFIWTDRGCAKAILSIYALSKYETPINLEFQSLCEQPIEAMRREEMTWSPTVGGIQFQPVKNVPPPGISRVQRSAQMNAIARTFRGEFAPDTNPNVFTELRLLSKPVYRYESTDPKILDGAVYGFVASTDPELLLVIEAHHKGDKTEWVFAGARSRHDHLRLWRGAEMIWDTPQLAPPWPAMRDPSKPYFNQWWHKLADSSELDRIDGLFDLMK